MIIEALPPDYVPIHSDLEEGEVYAMSDGSLFLVADFAWLCGPPDQWQLREIRAGVAKLVGLDGSDEGLARRAAAGAWEAQSAAQRALMDATIYGKFTDAKDAQ